MDVLKMTDWARLCFKRETLSLYQLIDEPTHFTEHSSSIIDLVFATNKDNVILSGVGDPFLQQNIRYHSPSMSF